MRRNRGEKGADLRVLLWMGSKGMGRGGGGGGERVVGGPRWTKAAWRWFLLMYVHVAFCFYLCMFMLLFACVAWFDPSAAFPPGHDISLFLFFQDYFYFFSSFFFLFLKVIWNASVCMWCLSCPPVRLYGTDLPNLLLLHYNAPVQVVSLF